MGKETSGRDIKNVNPEIKQGQTKDKQRKKVVGRGRRRRWQRKRELEQSETKHYVFCFLKRLMPPLPLTSAMTRRKQTDTPRLSLLRPVARALPRWGTDHGRHRLGVNRVPFIWLDAAGGPIRQPRRGWGRGRPMLSQPLKLTSSLGTLQTTVKLIKLPEKMSQYVWAACQRSQMRITAIWRHLHVAVCCVTQQIPKIHFWPVWLTELEFYTSSIHTCPNTTINITLNTKCALIQHKPIYESIVINFRYHHS